MICRQRTGKLTSGAPIPIPSASAATVSTRVRSLEEVEREHIVVALTRANWQIEGDRGAAKLLNLQKSTAPKRGGKRLSLQLVRAFRLTGSKFCKVRNFAPIPPDSVMSGRVRCAVECRNSALCRGTKFSSNLSPKDPREMAGRSRGISRPHVSWAQREKRYEPYFSEKISTAPFSKFESYPTSSRKRLLSKIQNRLNSFISRPLSKTFVRAKIGEPLSWTARH